MKFIVMGEVLTWMAVKAGQALRMEDVLIGVAGAESREQAWGEGMMWCARMILRTESRLKDRGWLSVSGKTLKAVGRNEATGSAVWLEWHRDRAQHIIL